MTQPKDTPDLLQASGEPFLALAEEPSAFHSRSSLILGQLRSVEAQFRSFWGVERLGKVPQDLQQSWVAVGHQSQRQLKLLRLCISSLEALAAGTTYQLLSLYAFRTPSLPSFFKSEGCFHKVGQHRHGLFVRCDSAGDRGVACVGLVPRAATSSSISARKTQPYFRLYWFICPKSLRSPPPEQTILETAPLLHYNPIKWEKKWEEEQNPDWIMQGDWICCA